MSNIWIMSQCDATFDLKYRSQWPILHGSKILSYVWNTIYTPGIYAEVYIVFVFPFICSYIRSFVRTSVPFELLQSFTCKQLERSISHQPLIRKHSYLDHRYPGESAFIPWLLTPGSMPWGGARGQKFFYFSVRESTYADSWSDMAQPCDMDLWVMKWRSAWPIFHSLVILSCILKTIWCMYIILWEYEPVWPDVWPQN